MGFPLHHTQLITGIALNRLVIYRHCWFDLHSLFKGGILYLKDSADEKGEEHLQFV